MSDGQPDAGISRRVRAATVAVDRDRLREADRDSANWLTHGRTYDEQRFSPLRAIDTLNVDRLGLTWSVLLDTRHKVEATPLVVDGAMFTTTAWNVILALDATDGRLLWRFDPHVPRAWLRYICCGPINRGLALFEGKLFMGTLDGRLVAVDAATGELVWSVRTTDPDQPYSITGAPRIAGDLVIIGNSGGEYGVRGYVSAYAAATGEFVWRTYAVPGNPAEGFETEAMRVAAETWTGEWWTAGGGGTIWDAIVYDPERELVYVGTGNGTPHNRNERSPGGGDNLYLASILALRAETGEQVWYYQTTPEESSDYTATQPLMQAALTIDGRPRDVIMQAPKNGFFYVLDRDTGELLAADPFVPVGWATHVDLASGRPVRVPDTHPPDRAWLLQPGPHGGHNWQPMSFHPATGLVYLPALESQAQMVPDPTWEYDPRWRNTATGANEQVGWDPTIDLIEPRGYLLAWDPVAREPAWRVPLETPINGGTLATAGGLVFQGTGGGRLAAYRARDGVELWSTPTGVGVAAAPITYSVGGRQYLAVMAGATWPNNAGGAQLNAQGRSRILTYRLDGTADPPTSGAGGSNRPAPGVAHLPLEHSPTEIQRGTRLYHRFCAPCHGASAWSSGAYPDLRYSLPATFWSFEDIVLEGAREHAGMPSFPGALTTADVELIRAYLLVRARALSER